MSESEDVKVYLYDLSHGVASKLSPILMGKKVDGIWHTGVVVYGKEYFFGSGGIRAAEPGSVVGEPLDIINVGKTHIPFAVFEDYINALNESEFSGQSYNILEHNCNNFSDEICKFLVGSGIPEHILNLPHEIVNTGLAVLFDNGIVNSTMAEEGGSTEMVAEKDASERIAEEMAQEEMREREERRRNREPPIVFKDAIDIHIEFDALVGLIDGKLNEEEQQSLEELHQYMLQDEGSWALGDAFLSFIGRLLTDKSLGEEVSVRCLNVLAAAALKDDVILMLHQDRRQHILMNYAFEVDRLPLPQQRALTLFMCNLFENVSSSEWMLYISEWPYNNTSISNIRVTTKVAVDALLSEDQDLKDRGTAILYNLATKEVKTVVFDDVAVELTMAILQFLGGTPSECQVFRCLKSLVKFCQISSQDVPQLIQMIGPHPSKFKGQSERNDKLIDEISARIK